MNDGRVNDPYALLTTHAEQWAAKAKRPLDSELLSTALNLRDSQDRMPGTSWPTGSAEYLMTVRWPGHGPLGVPDVDALVDTLDTFWRFLRATGRLASGSADPKALLSEARRSKNRMREKCVAPAAFGSTKNLQAYGAEIGISLDDAESAEDVQTRFGQLIEAWNALPIEERRRRDPGPVGADSARSRELAEILGQVDLNEIAMQMGEDDPAEFDDEIGVDVALPVQDPAEVLAVIEKSTYHCRLNAFVEAIGESGREVTSAGWLRPAVARELIAELEIDQWAERVLGLRQHEFRSSADHVGLALLFSPAIDSDLLAYRGNSVVRVPEPPDDDLLTTVTRALGGLVTLHRRARTLFLGDPLPGIILGTVSGELRGRAELEDWWLRAPSNPIADSEEFGPANPAMQRSSLRHFGQAMTFWAEAGLFTEEGGRVRITPLGIDFMRVLINLSEIDLPED